MPLAVTLTGIAILAVGFVVAGALNGLAGFGFAIAGTMTLATVLDPSLAVVFMIAPILAVNLSLLRELSGEDVRRCVHRFWPLVGAALVGTLFGLFVVDRIPVGPLRLGLGILTVGFVVTVQDLVPVPGERAIRDWCFVDTNAAMIGVGSVGGLLFGGTNVGIQLIAYLRSFDLDHATFVGVVAMVFLGLNAVRLAAAGVLGMYPRTELLVLSVGAAIPALAGVRVGRWIRGVSSEPFRRYVVLGLLGVIGLRLAFAGVQGV